MLVTDLSQLDVKEKDWKKALTTVDADGDGVISADEVTTTAFMTCAYCQLRAVPIGHRTSSEGNGSPDKGRR